MSTKKVIEVGKSKKTYFYIQSSFSSFFGEKVIFLQYQRGAVVAAAYLRNPVKDLQSNLFHKNGLQHASMYIEACFMTLCVNWYLE